MALRMCVLASGSSGNCTLVSSGETAILVDAGLSCREIERRLGLLGFHLHQIQAVCLSHEHGDHNNPGAVGGNPKVLKGEGEWKIGGSEIRGIASFHDAEKGSQRGTNTIFCFTVDGLHVCHMGDLGQLLSENQISGIGQVDVLLIPVGGFYTIDSQQASAVAASLKARITIPMHYKTDKCAYPIAGVEEFLKGRIPVRKLDSSEIDLQAGNLPAGETLVLKHAL
jgi:L-ascorbate metabolism protein UlaG (beta-lactamase superfamily)